MNGVNVGVNEIFVGIGQEKEKEHDREERKNTLENSRVIGCNIFRLCFSLLCNFISISPFVSASRAHVRVRIYINAIVSKLAR